MSGAVISPVGLAANALLKQIAAQDGQLLRVLSTLELVEETNGKRLLRFEAPKPLDGETIEAMVDRLESVLQPGLLQSIERRTGLVGRRILGAAVEQLRLIASFAMSDGGAVRENVGAVERLVRSGGVEMFALA